MFEAAFPFEYGPSSKIVLCKFAKDGFEIHLSVTERTKPAGTVDPALVSAVYSLFSGRIEFRVFHMEHPDSFVIIINIGEVVELLQNKMRGIIEQAGARMVSYFFQESFIRNSIMQVFPRMNFITKVHSVFIKNIQDGFPSFSEFPETGIYQSGGSLRPRIKCRPEQCTAETPMGTESQVF